MLFSSKKSIIVQNQQLLLYMRVKNITEFRKSMKETFDEINENQETVVISRSEDRDIVMLSLKNYNSIQETLYQMSSPRNMDRLTEAVNDINEMKNIVTKDLLF